MQNKALGIFETFGFVPALTGADAALKSAEVELLGCRYVGSGLVSVLVVGDVSSVKVAVDAGCSAADQVGSVRWCTVIARTAEGLAELVAEIQPQTRTPEQPPKAKNAAPTKSRRKKAPAKSMDLSLQQLYGLHVKDLRGLARKLAGLSLDRAQIRSARKDELINAIISYDQKQKE
jgi:microcompartment protein CcmL/EutN